jgi:hypothetical protein
MRDPGYYKGDFLSSCLNLQERIQLPELLGKGDTEFFIKYVTENLLASANFCSEYCPDDWHPFPKKTKTLMVNTGVLKNVFTNQYIDSSSTSGPGNPRNSSGKYDAVPEYRFTRIQNLMKRRTGKRGNLLTNPSMIFYRFSCSGFAALSSLSQMRVLNGREG